MRSVICPALFFVVPIIIGAQSENWVFRYDNGGNDSGQSLVCDDNGNIYIAGSYSIYYIGSFFCVISLTPSGDTNWVYQDSSGDGWGTVNSIVFGLDRNIYAAGRSYGTGLDFTVVSLTTAGYTNWIYRYESGLANAVVFGNDTTIYAAGYAQSATSEGNDFTIISLTTAGDTNWVYQYDGSYYGGAEGAYSIAYGDDGNIYSAGTVWNNGCMSDFIVASLTTTGDTNWLYTYNNPWNLRDEARALIFGSDGNIYAAGYSDNSDSVADFIVISLTPTGNTNWIYRYNGPGNSGDGANAIMYGLDNNIYAAGSSMDVSTGNNLILISLLSTGDTNWVYRYNGPGCTNSTAASIAYDIDRNNIIVGGYGHYGGNTDIIVVSVNYEGSTNWVYRYDGDDDDDANAIIYYSDNNDVNTVYVVGTSYENYNYDIIVISLSPISNIRENSIDIKSNNYTTIFAEKLPYLVDKNIQIFDITGRQIHTLDPAPGIYFVEIDGEIQQKIIKIR